MLSDYFKIARNADQLGTFHILKKLMENFKCGSILQPQNKFSVKLLFPTTIPNLE